MRRLAFLAAPARSTRPPVDLVEQEFKTALLPALRALAKQADTGKVRKVYGLSLCKLKGAAEYPEGYAGERFATGADAFGAAIEQMSPGLHPLGRPAFVGAQKPGMAALKQRGMTFGGFDTMALMEWNSAPAMLEGFEALETDSGDFADAAVHHGAGLEQQAWLCFSPFEPAPDAEYDQSYVPAGPMFVDEAEAAFFPALLPSLQAADNDPIYCLNFYKFKDSPVYPDDYTGQRFKTGLEAHQHYVNVLQQICRHTMAQAEMLFYGQLTPGIPTLCREGLAFNGYDTMALMKYDSAEAMLAMVSSPEYNAVAVHRAAGVAEQTFSIHTPTSAKRF